MQEYDDAIKEKQRLAALREYRLPADPSFAGMDELCWLASELCQTKYSLVSIIDEQKEFIIAGNGLRVHEPEKENTIASFFRNHTGETLAVHNMQSDKNWKNHPWVAGEPYIMSFAGVPLLSPEGFVLGFFCVMDTKPRTLADKQARFIQIISGQVRQLLESRNEFMQLQSLKQERERQNEAVYQFKHTVTHDIKSPLSSIALVSEMLREYFGDGIEDENEQLLGVLNRATAKIRKILEDLQADSPVK